jgi:hypothetical protein
VPGKGGFFNNKCPCDPFSFFLFLLWSMIYWCHYITKYWAFDVLLLTRLSASLCNQLVSTNELAHLQDQSPCFAPFPQLDIQFIFAFLFF